MHTCSSFEHCTSIRPPSAATFRHKLIGFRLVPNRAHEHMTRVLYGVPPSYSHTVSLDDITIKIGVQVTIRNFAGLLFAKTPFQIQTTSLLFAQFRCTSTFSMPSSALPDRLSDLRQLMEQHNLEA